MGKNICTITTMTKIGGFYFNFSYKKELPQSLYLVFDNTNNLWPPITLLFFEFLSNLRCVLERPWEMMKTCRPIISWGHLSSLFSFSMLHFTSNSFAKWQQFWRIASGGSIVVHYRRNTVFLNDVLIWKLGILSDKISTSNYLFTNDLYSLGFRPFNE